MQLKIYGVGIIALVLLLLHKTYLFYAACHSRRNLVRKNGCQPARSYPHRERIFGLDYLYTAAKAFNEHKLLETLSGVHATLGKTIAHKVLGKAGLLTIEPENVKCMLATKFRDFGLGPSRKSAFQPLFGSGIFNADGTKWQHSRVMLRPRFARTSADQLELFERHVSQLIKSLPRDQSTVDLQERFLCLTLDIATEFMFGESTNSLAGNASAHHQEFATALQACFEVVCDKPEFSPAKIVQKIIAGFRFHGNLKAVHMYLDRYVQKALEHRRARDLEEVLQRDAAEKSRSLLHEMADKSDDPTIVRSEILNILLAGRDTTASLHGNTWFVLAKRPDVVAKMRQEIELLGGRKPTYQDLKEMKYLYYVLNESLRLYPIVAINQRTAEVDTVLPRGGGADGEAPIFVSRGTSVGYSIWAMHRNREVYGEDAEEFRPERWENFKPGWNYLPFHGGPRACLGQHFALTQAAYVTVRLMQEFGRIESRDSRPWEESIALNVSSRWGTKVSLTPAEET